MTDEPIIYAEDRAPDRAGPHGRAWKCDVEATARRYKNRVPVDLTVGGAAQSRHRLSKPVDCALQRLEH